MLSTQCKMAAALLIVGTVACGKPSVQVSRNDDSPDMGESRDGAITFPDGSVPTGISPEVREAHDALTVAECTTAFRCCSEAELDAEYGEFDGVEDCNANLQLFPESFGLSAYTTALEEGRIEFDVEMAQLCASSFSEQPCAEWTDPPLESRNPGCVEAVRPLTEPGESCKFEFECLDSFCQASAEPEGLGTCTAYAEESDDCVSEDVVCGDGLFCERFFAQTCIAQYAEGEPCTDDFECASEHCEVRPDNTRVCGAALPICLGE